MNSLYKWRFIDCCLSLLYLSLSVCLFARCIFLFEIWLNLQCARLDRYLHNPCIFQQNKILRNLIVSSWASASSENRKENRIIIQSIWKRENCTTEKLLINIKSFLPSTLSLYFSISFTNRRLVFMPMIANTKGFVLFCTLFITYKIIAGHIQFSYKLYDVVIILRGDIFLVWTPESCCAMCAHCSFILMEGNKLFRVVFVRFDFFFSFPIIDFGLWMQCGFDHIVKCIGNWVNVIAVLCDRIDSWLCYEYLCTTSRSFYYACWARMWMCVCIFKMNIEHSNAIYWFNQFNVE